MHYVERDAFIIDKLKHEGKVVVNDLAAELNVSSMTIRRDLDRLEQQGLLHKVHGAALPVDTIMKERAFGEKQLIRLHQKQSIAREAAKLVKSGDTILLDAGTTTFEMVQFIKSMSGVDVVTNDIHIAMELCSSSGRLFYIGGEIEKELGRSTGTKAFQFLADIHVDIAFLGVSSVTRDMYLCSYTVDNAELKRLMINCAARNVLLVDQSKFGTTAFAQVGPLSLADDLITDRVLSEQELTYLEKNNITLHRVD